MPFTPAAQRTRSPPVRYHPGVRPGNRDGASDLESEGGRARSSRPESELPVGESEGAGDRSAGGGLAQRRPPAPSTPALPASSTISFSELGPRGWGGRAPRAEPQRARAAGSEAAGPGRALDGLGGSGRRSGGGARPRGGGAGQSAARARPLAAGRGAAGCVPLAESPGWFRRR